MGSTVAFESSRAKESWMCTADMRGFEQGFRYNGQRVRIRDRWLRVIEWVYVYEEQMCVRSKNRALTVLNCIQKVWCAAWGDTRFRCRARIPYSNRGA